MIISHIDKKRFYNTYIMNVKKTLILLDYRQQLRPNASCNYKTVFEFSVRNLGPPTPWIQTNWSDFEHKLPI